MSEYDISFKIQLLGLALLVFAVIVWVGAGTAVFLTGQAEWLLVASRLTIRALLITGIALAVLPGVIKTGRVVFYTYFK